MVIAAFCSGCAPHRPQVCAGGRTLLLLAPHHHVGIAEVEHCQLLRGRSDSHRIQWMRLDGFALLEPQCRAPLPLHPLGSLGMTGPEEQEELALLDLGPQCLLELVTGPERQTVQKTQRMGK